MEGKVLHIGKQVIVAEDGGFECTFRRTDQKRSQHKLLGKLSKHRDSVLFMSWTEYSARSSTLAKELEAEAVFISSGRAGNIWTAPARYISQSIRTLGILLR